MFFNQFSPQFRGIQMIGRGFLQVVLAAIILGAALPAAAEIRFSDGWWRTELNGAAGLHAGNDRKDDVLITGSVEYEFPVHAHATNALRLMPLFVYDQDEGDTVWGGGIGVVARFFWRADAYRGWFGEIEANAIGHENKITGNSSNFNFLTGAGLGYKFSGGWHAIVKVQHISNAGLGDENSGANLAGAALGYSF